MKRLGYQTYLSVFGVVYLGLMTGFLVIVACLPMLALVLGTDPAVTWPLIALTAPLAFAAASAAFAVFRGYSDDGAVAVVRPFWAAWWAGLRRSLAIGALTSAAITVAACDIAFLWGRPIGAAAIPLLATAIVLVAGTALVALVAGQELPSARLRDVLKAALFVAIRRWYLTALSLLLAAVFGALVTQAPALALGFGTAPLLYLIWANGRSALFGVLRPSAPAPLSA